MFLRNKVFEVTGERLDEREVIHLLQVCLMAGSRMVWFSHERYEGLEQVTIQVEADETFERSFNQFRPERWPTFDQARPNVKVSFVRDIPEAPTKTTKSRSKKVQVPE